jgi:hypothetical protein
MFSNYRRIANLFWTKHKLLGWFGERLSIKLPGKQINGATAAHWNPDFPCPQKCHLKQKGITD